MPHIAYVILGVLLAIATGYLFFPDVESVISFLGYAAVITALASFIVLAIVATIALVCMTVDSFYGDS